MELTKFNLNERGGTLLTREDGFAAVLCRPVGEAHIVAEWINENDPAFHIYTTFDSPEQLRRQFWDIYSGWYVRRDHLDLPRASEPPDGTMVAEYDLSGLVDEYMTVMLGSHDENKLWEIQKDLPDEFGLALEYATNWLSEVKGWQTPSQEPAGWLTDDSWKDPEGDNPPRGYCPAHQGEVTGEDELTSIADHGKCIACHKRWQSGSYQAFTVWIDSLLGDLTLKKSQSVRIFIPDELVEDSYTLELESDPATIAGVWTCYTNSIESTQELADQLEEVLVVLGFEVCLEWSDLHDAPDDPAADALANHEVMQGRLGGFSATLADTVGLEP